MQYQNENIPVMPFLTKETGVQKQSLPVAVMDSGVGGLCVLHEIRRVLPCEELLYFGDSAYAPYGERNTEELRAHILLEAERLLQESKALVLACNTATALVADELRRRHPDLPIVGMEPALKPALDVCENPRILVLATRVTLGEKKFADLAQKCEKNATVVQICAPKMVEMIEKGQADSPEMQVYVKELLAPYCTQRVDALVLGCTHFPFAQKAILRAIGRDVPVFDGIGGTALQLRRMLDVHGLRTPSPTRGAVRLTSSRARILPFYAELLFGVLE